MVLPSAAPFTALVGLVRSSLLAIDLGAAVDLAALPGSLAFVYTAAPFSATLFSALSFFLVMVHLPAAPFTALPFFLVMCVVFSSLLADDLGTAVDCFSPIPSSLAGLLYRIFVSTALRVFGTSAPLLIPVVGNAISTYYAVVPSMQICICFAFLVSC